MRSDIWRLHRLPHNGLRCPVPDRITRQAVQTGLIQQITIAGAQTCKIKSPASDPFEVLLLPAFAVTFQRDGVKTVSEQLLQVEAHPFGQRVVRFLISSGILLFDATRQPSGACHQSACNKVSIHFHECRAAKWN